MPTLDFPVGLTLTLELLKSIASLAFVTWFFLGGWQFLGRKICWFIDIKIVDLISRVYHYIITLLNGTMFNGAVVTALLRNVYMFIGVIMFFRLMMVVIKYLVNPDLVSDAKLGMSSLIKRCIIGLIGIIFVPTIFNIALEFQESVISDQLIQRIIMPQSMYEDIKKMSVDGGRYIGTYVLAGFLNPSEVASGANKKAYDLAIKNNDLGSLGGKMFLDGWLGAQYQFDYLFLISTFCLGYVLYIMVKYCLDVVVRFFRMLLYQLLAPIAMIEYMINGADDGVFKSWKKAVLSTYFMLFVRILSLWFVLFVISLMRTDGVYAQGSLLTTNDWFLKAIIIMGLLGFMLDLPKLIGDIFGLDLEQDGNASGIFKQVGGMLKGAAVGALALGGAAVGGAVAMGKAGLAQTKLGKGYNASKEKLNEKHPSLAAMGQARKRMNSGFLGAALGSNQFTGSAYKGMKEQNDAVNGSNQKARDSEKAKKKENEQAAIEASRHEDLMTNARRQEIREVTEIVKRENPTALNGVIAANVTARSLGLKLDNPNTTNATAYVSGKMVASLQGDINGKETTETVSQKIHKVVSEQLDVPLDEVEQRVKRVVDDGGKLDSPAAVKQVVDQVVGQIAEAHIGTKEQEITQIVNQMYGTMVGNSAGDATQTVNQQLGAKVGDSNISQTAEVTAKVDKVDADPNQLSIPGLEVDVDVDVDSDKLTEASSSSAGNGTPSSKNDNNSEPETFWGNSDG